jgi:hypothetical protein
MTTQYRTLREQVLASAYKGQDVLALSETFDRSALDRLLAQPDCKSIRIYYGMDAQSKVHSILVGVDGEGKDILPKTSDSVDGEILEDGQRCPVSCPPESPLNS